MDVRDITGPQLGVRVGTALTYRALDRKQAFLFWTALTAGYLILAGTASFLSPIGYWRNFVLGFTIYNEVDPTGPYVGSALHFFSPGYPHYVGHPGLTLQLVVYVVARLYLLPQQLLADQAFMTLAARNIHSVFAVSKLAMTALHLVSFRVLFVFARRLLKDEHAALLATLGYATSYPVLYYLSRVSTEPLIVAFFLLAVMSIWSYQERALASTRLDYLIPVAAAAIYSSAGLFTKVHILGPLPAFCLVFILWGGPRGQRASLKRRVFSSGVFLACMTPLVAIGSLRVAWTEFFGFWLQHSPARQGSTEEVHSMGAQLLGFLRSIPDFVSSTIPSYWQASARGSFAILECAFLAAAAVGFVMFLRGRSEERPRLLMPVLYGAFVLIVFVYHAAWHYLFIIVALAAVFFGHALHCLIERVQLRQPASRWLLARAVVVVLVFHFAAVYAVVDSRLTDIAIYETTAKPYHDALDGIEADERVAVVSHPGHLVNAETQLFAIYLGYLPWDCELFDAQRDLFLSVEADSLPLSDETTNNLHQNRVSVVVYEPEGFEGPVTEIQPTERERALQRRSPQGPVRLRQDP